MAYEARSSVRWCATRLRHEPMIALGPKCGTEVAADSSSPDGLYGWQPNVRCNRRALAGLTGWRLALGIAEAGIPSVDGCALAVELGR